MSTDEIISMARAADPFGDDGRLVSLAMLTPGTLERFAALVAAKEREDCAQACEQAISSIWGYAPEDVQRTGRNVCTNLASAIRARSTP